MRILMMLTRGQDNTSGRQIGLDQVVALYYLLHDDGIEVVVVSFLGGSPLIRCSRNRSEGATVLQRFHDDRWARDAFSDTLRFAQIYPDDFDAGICVGVLEETAESDDLAAACNLIDALLLAAKPVVVIPSDLCQPPPGPGEGLLITGAPACSPRIAAMALLTALEPGGP